MKKECEFLCEIADDCRAKKCNEHCHNYKDCNNCEFNNFMSCKKKFLYLGKTHARNLAVKKMTVKYYVPPEQKKEKRKIGVYNIAVIAIITVTYILLFTHNFINDGIVRNLEKNIEILQKENRKIYKDLAAEKIKVEIATEKLAAEKKKTAAKKKAGIDYEKIESMGFDKKLAKKIAKKTSKVIHPKIAIAIAIIESGIGKADNGCNIFGVSYNEVGIRYGSVDKAIENFLKIIENKKYYSELDRKTSITTQIKAIKLYNTVDQNYQDKIKNIIERISV